MAGPDPEVRQLSLAYARAVAITERLAEELDKTVADLAEFVDRTQQRPEPAVEPDAPTQPLPTAKTRRTRGRRD